MEKSEYDGELRRDGRFGYRRSFAPAIEKAKRKMIMAAVCLPLCNSILHTPLSSVLKMFLHLLPAVYSEVAEQSIFSLPGNLYQLKFGLQKDREDANGVGVGVSSLLDESWFTADSFLHRLLKAIERIG
ncbi:hypothetical protein LINPERPRIM_LOCUS6697 [Linum perenne]